MKRQDTLIKISDLVLKREDKLIFGPVSFELAVGECLGIRGANGSGKTSLLKIIAGLLVPSEGQVHVNADPHYMSHILPLDPRLTTQQNLGFLGGGVDEFDDVPLLTLSQGQQKKLFLSYYVSDRNKKLWLMDEPFAHLDQAAITKLGHDMKAHQANGGGVIFTHHGELPVVADEELLL